MKGRSQEHMFRNINQIKGTASTKIQRQEYVGFHQGTEESSGIQAMNACRHDGM